jgi:hypothetical protein
MLCPSSRGYLFLPELYIDTKKESYKALNFRRYNIFTVIAAIFIDASQKLISWVSR